MALGLATLALAAGVAHAQPAPASSSNKEQAAKYAAEAEALGKKQQFADALKQYKEAAKLDPGTAAYQCNIGMAYYALGDEARAHLYFGRCYRANGGWPANVEDVFNYVVGVLGKKDFTPLKISGTPAEAEVLVTLYADEGPLVAPVTVYVPFANYQIQVHAEGYETQTIPVEANNQTEKKVEYRLVPAAKGEGSGSSPTGAGAAGGNLVGSGGDIDQDVGTGGGRKAWPLYLSGGGVVAVIGGFLAFRAAKSKQDELCGPNITVAGNCDSAIKTGEEEHADTLEGDMRTRERVAYGLFGIGAAAIGAGVVLYFMQPKESESSVSVSAAPTSGGGMLVFSLTR